MFENYYQELGISSNTSTNNINIIIRNEMEKLKIKKQNLKNNLGLIRDLTLTLNEINYRIERLKKILFHLGNELERAKYDKELADFEKILPLDAFKEKEQQFSHNLNQSFFDIINYLIDIYNKGLIIRNIKEFNNLIKEFYKLKRRVKWVQENCSGKDSVDAEWLLEKILKTKFIEIIIEGELLSPTIIPTNHQIVTDIAASPISESEDELKEITEELLPPIDMDEYMSNLEKEQQITKKISELKTNNILINKEIENLQKQKKNPVINFLFNIFTFGCYNKNRNINEKINIKNNELQDNMTTILKLDKQRIEFELLYNKKSTLPDIVPIINHHVNNLLNEQSTSRGYTVPPSSPKM